MKVFITGATGFLGSAVTLELSKRGHEVIGLAKDKQSADIIRNAGGRPVMGDPLQGGDWCEEIQKVDKVVSMEKPIDYIEGSLKDVTMEKMSEYGHRYAEAVTNVIKAAADGRAKGVIVTFSTLCFGDRKGQWVSDADALDPIGYCRPLTGYFETISKAAEDAGLPLIEIYPSLVYGNGGWFKRVVGDFQNKTAKVVEPGDNYLSLIHVEDAAVYYALAVEKLDKNESFCLADDRPVQQRVLMDHIADLLDVKPAPDISLDSFNREYGMIVGETMSSSTRVQGIKAMDLLGYIPKLRSYEAGVRYTLKQMGIEPRRKELEEAA